MAVVEPEAACVHQHIPVIRVSEGGEGRGEAHRASGGGDEERKEEEEGLLFLSVWGFAFTKWSTNVCVTIQFYSLKGGCNGNGTCMWPDVKKYH